MKSINTFIKEEKGAALRPFIATVFILGLFALACFAFLGQFVAQNNPTSPILTNPALNTTASAINASLSTIQSQINVQQNLSQSDRTQSSISVFLILDSVITTGWNLLGLTPTIINALSGFIFTKVFGGGAAILFTVVLGILAMTGILLVIKYFRTGESER